MHLFVVIALLLTASLPLCALADEYEDLFSADLRGRSVELPEISEKSHLHEAHPHGGRHYDDHRHHAHRHYHYDNPEVVFRYIFSKSKVKFDPRAESSPFFWATAPNLPPSDSAHRRQQYNRVSLISLPHASPVAPDPVAGSPDYDMGVRTDETFSFDEKRYGRTQHLAARAQLSCQQFGVEHHPFPSDLVANAQDDLRLAACSFGLSNREQPRGFRATIAFTNRGIWAVYTAFKRQSQSVDNDDEGDGFVQVRRLATRSDKKATHNVAVEVTDRGEAIFRVEDHALWSVDTLGVPSYDRRAVTTARYGDAGRYEVRNLAEMRLLFAADSSLDYSDPNYAKSPVALVRLDDPYSSKTTFYDDEAKRTNRLFGQGTQMDMYEVSVVKWETYDGRHHSSRYH